MEILWVVLITLGAVGTFNIILYAVLQEMKVDYDEIYPKITWGFGWIVFFILKFFIDIIRLILEFKNGSLIRIWGKHYYCIKCNNPFYARILMRYIKKKNWVYSARISTWLDREMAKSVRETMSKNESHFKIFKEGVVLVQSPKMR